MSGKIQIGQIKNTINRNGNIMWDFVPSLYSVNFDGNIQKIESEGLDICDMNYVVWKPISEQRYELIDSNHKFPKEKTIDICLKDLRGTKIYTKIMYIPHCILFQIVYFIINVLGIVTKNYKIIFSYSDQNIILTSKEGVQYMMRETWKDSSFLEKGFFTYIVSS